MHRSGILSGSRKIYFPVFEWYKKLKGDLRVKTLYEIPKEAGITIPPEFFSSNKLGNYVHTIRQQMAGTGKANYCENDIKTLCEMGFVANAHDDKNQRIVKAMTEYHKKHDNFNIVKDFKIPKDDESWSKEVRGLNLGSILNTIRNHDVNKEIHGQLTSMGVDIGPQVDYIRCSDCFQEGF